MTALARVLRKVGDPTLDVLARLPGADLTTLLLALMRRRAGELSAPDVLRRYREDRFVVPAAVPFRQLRAAEERALDALPEDFDVLTLAPLAPLGTHSALATVDQNKVVSTIRSSEVAADPTNALALEAAVRRRAGQGAKLAAVQRVVRAQQVEGAATFAHFTLLGVVSAGRDTGNLEFERRHLVEHLRFLASLGPVRFGLTCLDPRFQSVADAVSEHVDAFDDSGRESRRGYYQGLCFKAYWDGAEIGDGGFVDWTSRLLADRKERLLISGLGIDRLALLTQE